MPIAAVPAYLGTDFTQASPGLRFGMDLKLWEGDAWSNIKEKPLDSAKCLNANDQKTMCGLFERQRQTFDISTQPAVALRLEAKAVAPFTTGLGNTHPLENGFAFLNPYGLPYLPGSGVKGVLRQAAHELANGEWGDTQGWREAKGYAIKVGKETVPLSQLDALFGLESQDGDKTHVRGALTFWDVIPQIQGNSLMVEIMTPHQSHYYQGGQSPHDSGQPTPISFLTVPPGSSFAFHVHCDLAHLKRLAPELAEGERWKTLLTAAFAHAFQWLGFGAKTAVGYGAMQVDEQAIAQAEAQRLAAEKKAARASKSPQAQKIDDYIEHMQRRWKDLSGKPTRINGEEHNRTRQLAKTAREDPAWTAEEKRAAADAIDKWLPEVVAVDIKDERKKLKLAALRGE